MLEQPQPGKCFNAYKVKQTINGHTRRPFKEQLHREGKAQEKRQCRSGVGRFCGREKLPLFLPPRTSCLRGELYIELREWLNRQWSGSQCGRTLLREAGGSHRPCWQPSSNCRWKMSEFQLGVLKSWPEVTNLGGSIPKRLSHPFDPLGLWNMLCEGFCFFHMKQILTVLYLEGRMTNYKTPE